MKDKSKHNGRKILFSEKQFIIMSNFILKIQYSPVLTLQIEPIQIKIRALLIPEKPEKPQKYGHCNFCIFT